MNYAVILSGGVGSRMQTDGTPKQYLEVCNKPVLAYTLEKFENCAAIDSIVIVAETEWQSTIKEWIAQYHISKFCAFAVPGVQRQGSILNGLNSCMQFNPSKDDLVIIHDAARPLVTDDMICKCLNAAKEYGGCMPVLPVTDTIYQSMNGTDIVGLLDRNTLYAGQAPEAFRLVEYTQINRAVTIEELNSYKGTSEIAYKYGMKIHLIPGDENNFKLTTPKDLEKFVHICKENT